MDKKKLLRISGEIFFILAIINFLGIPDLFGSTRDANRAISYSILSEILFIPDFKTIGLAGISAFLGDKLRELCAENGESTRTGTRLLVGGILCALLTFTPISRISMLPALLNLTSEQLVPDEYSTIPEEDYMLHAFLGSSSSKPEDVDIFAYKQGYDGKAEEEYENYKICGYLFNQTEENWSYVRMEFVLVDAEGNDILIDGEPVVLQMTRDLRRRSSRKLKFFSSSKEELKMTIHAGSFGMFETDTIKAKDLPVHPVNFRVKSVQRANFEDFDFDVEFEIVLD